MQFKNILEIVYWEVIFHELFNYPIVIQYANVFILQKSAE